MVSKEALNIDARFGETVAVVEGCAFDLWQNNQKEFEDGIAMSWEQDSRGCVVEVGRFHSMPVMLTLPRRARGEEVREVVRRERIE